MSMSLIVGRESYFEYDPVVLTYENSSTGNIKSGCCCVVSNHLFERGILYHKTVGNHSKSKALCHQLNHFEKIIEKARVLLLNKAHDGYRQCGMVDKLQELEDELTDHFKNHVVKLVDKGLASEAEKLVLEWQKILNLIKEKRSLAGVINLIERFDVISDQNDEKVDNQIYRVNNTSVIHREKLPGKLMRSGGDGPTAMDEIDVPFDLSEDVLKYAAMQNIDFKEVLKGRPRKTSVNLTMDNAYWNGEQIVVGRGQHLFHNMATTTPANEGVLTHEWWHAVTEHYTGINLKNGVTGLDYVNRGRCDAGSINEMLSDIAYVSKKIFGLMSKNRHLKIDDAEIQRAYLIGPGLWKIKKRKADGSIETAGPNEAIRNLKTSFGYDLDGVVADMLGPPVEPHFRKWTDWHDNDGIVHNPLVRHDLVKSNPNEVDPHHGSACGEAVFVDQLESLISIVDISAANVHKIYLDAAKNTSFRTSYIEFAKNTIIAARAMESDLGKSNIESTVRNGWKNFDVPM